MTSSKREEDRKTLSSKVRLVPWDPTSPSHVQRLFDQRVVCGWKSEKVKEWAGLQKEGKIAIQWVVLSEKIPDRDTKLQTHIAAFPDEEEELVDSASSLGGKPREPTIEKFLPIGHISLYTEYETPGLEFTVFKPEEGVCWIATFYISHVLQSAGLGRAAMDTIEATATSHPLNAKVLALSTVARDYDGKEEKWEAMGWNQLIEKGGRARPKIENQDWYERRGYVVYARKEAMWSEKDKSGRLWPSTAVFMRKAIR